MFRLNQDSELSRSKFSVGSIIVGEYAQRWLIVGKGKSVELVDLSTFKIVDNSSTKVEDLNFMSEQEVRDLVGDTIGKQLNWTFSDFRFDSRGLKS